MLLSFFGFGILFLGIGDAAYFQEVVRELGWGLLGAFPLWVAALSLANLLMFAIRSGTGASFAYMGLMLLTGTVLDLLDLLGYSVFGVMKGWLISTQLGNLYGTVGHWEQIAAAWGSGLDVYKRQPLPAPLPGNWGFFILILALFTAPSAFSCWKAEGIPGKKRT